MKNLNELDQYRTEHPFWPQTSTSGAFKVMVKQRAFYILASVDNTGEDGAWEHISVTPKNQNRCPTWDEMCAIKDMFFGPEEECVEFHPRKSEYVNRLENCLHIWKPSEGKLLRSRWEFSTLAERDKELEELWAELADATINPETERTEEPFLHFPVGTDREDIWHWFDERHSKGVAYLLYGGAEDYVPEARRLYGLKGLCTECDSESCVFNPNGVCLSPFITGHAPRVHDDGCLDFCYREER